MTAGEILARLEPLGAESYRKVLRNHGVRDPVYGVKVSDLKVILKATGTDYRLALGLYDTGVYDAMYLAGLMADDARMTRANLKSWVGRAYCPPLSEVTVPWVAASGRYGWDLGREWLDAGAEGTAAAGWCTLGSFVSITADDALDLPALDALLTRVRDTLPAQPDRVRSAMNGFVIGVGCYVAALTAKAVETAVAVGPVTIDAGNTACKVPSAAETIAKVNARGTLGTKRKTAKC